MAKIAVIDIGTNSIHMVLAEIQPDAGYKILDRFKDMTRLGNGAFTTHRLSDEAVTRGLDVVRNLVTKETGLKVRVSSGTEEARLISLAVKNSVPMTDQPTLSVDVGGGSVELMVGTHEQL